MQLDDLAHRALALMAVTDRPHRTIIAIAGSPGSGKTTLATALAARVNELTAASAALPPRTPTTGASSAHPRSFERVRMRQTGEADASERPPRQHSSPGAPTATAVHLPMDGFHLANTTLDALGLRDRKGAISTFDAWGFLAIIRRLSTETDHTIYAPGFDRAIDEAVAGQIAVTPDARLIITEGNYLLVDEPPWSLARPLFAETWFCVTPDAERLSRLIERHQFFGRTPAEARLWAETVDGANAALIEPTATRASLLIAD